MTDPSAALFFSTSITTRPPAPGRFSTILVDAAAFTCSARSLWLTSRRPPAGQPARARAAAWNATVEIELARDQKCTKRHRSPSPTRTAGDRAWSRDEPQSLLPLL